MTDDEAWEPAVDAIDAIFDGDYDRAEEKTLKTLGKIRKEREQERQEAQ